MKSKIEDIAPMMRVVLSSSDSTIDVTPAKEVRRFMVVEVER